MHLRSTSLRILRPFGTLCLLPKSRSYFGLKHRSAWPRSSRSATLPPMIKRDACHPVVGSGLALRAPRNDRLRVDAIDRRSGGAGLGQGLQTERPLQDVLRPEGLLEALSGVDDDDRDAGQALFRL